jgi:hypothetical protein
MNLTPSFDLLRLSRMKSEIGESSLRRFSGVVLSLKNSHFVPRGASISCPELRRLRSSSSDARTGFALAFEFVSSSTNVAIEI